MMLNKSFQQNWFNTAIVNYTNNCNYCLAVVDKVPKFTPCKTSKTQRYVINRDMYFEDYVKIYPKLVNFNPFIISNGELDFKLVPIKKYNFKSYMILFGNTNQCLTTLLTLPTSSSIKDLFTTCKAKSVIKAENFSNQLFYFNNSLSFPIKLNLQVIKKTPSNTDEDLIAANVFIKLSFINLTTNAEVNAQIGDKVNVTLYQGNIYTVKFTFTSYYFENRYSVQLKEVDLTECKFTFEKLYINDYLIFNYNKDTTELLHKVPATFEADNFECLFKDSVDNNNILTYRTPPTSTFNLKNNSTENIEFYGMTIMSPKQDNLYFVDSNNASNTKFTFQIYEDKKIIILNDPYIISPNISVTLYALSTTKSLTYYNNKSEKCINYFDTTRYPKEFSQCLQYENIPKTYNRDFYIFNTNLFQLSHPNCGGLKYNVYPATKGEQTMTENYTSVFPELKIAYKYGAK
jgi:hypothetical protein